MSLLVLLPLAAVLVTRATRRLGGFFDAADQPAVAAALRLTVPAPPASPWSTPSWAPWSPGCWCATGSRASGCSSLVIDVPFALPTIVAGLVLIALYGTEQPVGVNLAQTRWSIFVALLFVTLPFVVRAVQPVLEELDRDVEEAAASLGASRFTSSAG